MRTKVISEYEGSEQRWQLPEIQGSSRNVSPIKPEVAVEPALPTAAELEAIQKEAYKESFRLGYDEGKAVATKENQVLGKELHSVFGAIASAFDTIDHKFEQQLAGLALAIAKQVIRRELKTDPSQVVAVVKEGLRMMASSPSRVQVHLHPQDAQITEQALATEGSTHVSLVIEDPTVSRGGCTLSSDTSYVDATIETRIAEIAVQVMGGERAGEDAGATTANTIEADQS